MFNKRQKIFLTLTILTILFIWINSFMPEDVSKAESGAVNDVVNFLTPKEIRKIAHFTEFGILAIWLVQLFRDTLKKNLQTILLTGISVALIDETIQLFIIGRSGEIVDTWIDLGGFTAAALITMLIVYIRNKKRLKSPKYLF